MARMNWLIDGDHSTTLFHKVARQRATLNRIQLLRDGDKEITDPTEMGSHAVAYYSSLYRSEQPCVQTSLIDRVVLHLVTGDENDLLVAIPSEDEVKQTVFAMNPHSAPGLDGFTGLFYRSCWPIIYRDVVRAVMMFFEQDRIAHGFNSNIVALIPKKPGGCTSYF